ncbi:hypothetical protein LZ31DRAFT_213520 [Colletotrichum somersetense]|nr:hypothetical protein LZ31DRAFT_213520 [Colletotrichum somersetense]
MTSPRSESHRPMFPIIWSVNHSTTQLERSGRMSTTIMPPRSDRSLQRAWLGNAVENFLFVRLGRPVCSPDPARHNAQSANLVSCKSGSCSYPRTNALSHIPGTPKATQRLPVRATQYGTPRTPWLTGPKSIPTSGGTMRGARQTNKQGKSQGAKGGKKTVAGKPTSGTTLPQIQGRR